MSVVVFSAVTGMRAAVARLEMKGSDSRICGLYYKFVLARFWRVRGSKICALQDKFVLRGKWPR
ncbi:MAG: hypothetical protein ACJAQU_002761 [Loktanella salsilacus]|jgi:hypothetical protein